jgi:hypothetical protein
MRSNVAVLVLIVRLCRQVACAPVLCNVIRADFHSVQLFAAGLYVRCLYTLYKFICCFKKISL